MEIYLYKNTSENNAVNKNIVSPILLEGEIRDEQVNVSHPVISITGQQIILEYNYAYIPAFKRYYFFKDAPTIIRTGIYQIALDVDVLMSFKGTGPNYNDGFLGNSGLVSTSLNYGNFYLSDSELPLQQNTKLTTHKTFNTPFTGNSSSLVMNCLNIGHTTIATVHESESGTEHGGGGDNTRE